MALCFRADALCIISSDHQELVKADAVQSGWFPDWIPESAYDIKESHDMDTNESMLVFSIREPAWRPPSSCLSIEPAKSPPAPYARPWWPASEDLETRPDVSFYSCPDESYVGVDDLGQMVFHWRP